MEVSTWSKLVLRTNFTNNARPRTPSPTLNLIKININLNEPLLNRILNEINNPNKENISKIINREMK